MEKFLFVLGIMLITALIVGAVFFGLTPMGRSIWNQYWMQIHGDSPTVEQIKEVEDTCRKMIESWEADAEIFRLNGDVEAKMRANQTAEAYNEYIAKNSYVWNGNMPKDIYAAIEPIAEGDENENMQ